MKSDGTAVIVLWFVLAIVVVSAIGVGRGRNENATAEWPRITKIKRQFCLSRPDRATATQTPDDGGLDGRTERASTPPTGPRARETSGGGGGGGTGEGRSMTTI